MAPRWMPTTPDRRGPAKPPPLKQSARGFGKPPFLPKSAAVIFLRFNINEMSRHVARYRAADCVGIFGLDFASIVVYSRFITLVSIAFVLQASVLHGVPLAIVLGASRTSVARASQFTRFID